MWKGRTSEQKSKIAEGITQVFADAAGVPAEAMHVVFHDVDKSDWAIAGKLCSEND
jgi:4-oxalocrotonate tautomerase